jgi:acetyl esterase/lipase
MRFVQSCFNEVEVIKDIQFSEAVNYYGEVEQLKLDVYMPQGDVELNRPTILWIHGGGFRPGNDKEQSYIVDFANRFARKGYVCVSIDYRLRDKPREDFKGTMTDALSDGSDALEWIRRNGEAYGMDTSRIFIAGGSAGGMIAMHMCYGDNTYARTNLSGVLAVMNLWGSPHDSERNLSILPGGLPVLIVHGTADKGVKIENSYQLIELLKQAGVHHVFIPLEGAPHTPIAHIEHMDGEFSNFLYSFLNRENK